MKTHIVSGKKVPLKHWTCGFYRNPRIVELLERDFENKGTKAQYLHTFLSEHSKFQEKNRALFYRNKPQLLQIQNTEKQ